MKIERWLEKEGKDGGGRAGVGGEGSAQVMISPMMRRMIRRRRKIRRRKLDEDEVELMLANVRAPRTDPAAGPTGR